MKTTLFIGAGFSAAFGYPVMDSFFSYADFCKRVTDEERALLRELVLEARRANSFLESSPTNLEDILSFSEMGERLQLISGADSRTDRLRSIIQRVYSDVTAPKEYWPRYKKLEKFLGKDLSECKDSLSFVTTNYDLNIESACIAAQIQTDPGFEIDRIPGQGVRTLGSCYSTGGVPLYKLHGSVNWYPSDSEPGIRIDDRIVAIQSWDESRSLPVICTGDYCPAGSPAIVPPSFLKPDLSNALKGVWRGAARVLSEANTIVFVGYSFPPSDTEMMFFLAKALSENAGLRALYLVDPKANEITARLRRADTRIGSHFRDLLHPIQSRWEEAKLEV